MAEPIIMVLHPFPRYHDYKIQTSFSSKRDKRGGGNGTRGYSHLHDLGFFSFHSASVFYDPHPMRQPKKKKWCCPFISSHLNQHREPSCSLA